MGEMPGALGPVNANAYTRDLQKALMHAIRPLPEQLINQIAAGEVVERPAAALKELLETSRDAGATQVDLDLAGGGVKLIRVADDGLGIDREDLLFAVARKATSKISRASDLDAIGTRGASRSTAARSAWRSPRRLPAAPP